MRKGQLWTLKDTRYHIEVVPPLSFTSQWSRDEDLNLNMFSAHITSNVTSNPRTFLVMSDNIGSYRDLYKRWKILLGEQVVIFFAIEGDFSQFGLSLVKD
jgi:hypothetical protein